MCMIAPFITVLGEKARKAKCLLPQCGRSAAFAISNHMNVDFLYQHQTCEIS